MSEYILLKNNRKVKIVEYIRNLATNHQDLIVQESSGEKYVVSKVQLDELRVKEKFTKNEKLALFMRYFQGRKDVFAKRWNNGKGYSPYCAIEWNMAAHCPKTVNSKFKCEDCSVRQFVPFTSENVREHITKDEKYFYGIYPLLADDTTHLLVLDFDKEFAREEAQSVIASCKNFGVQPLIECSQSGKGIHVWLFFSQAIPAHLARKLGFYLLTFAMTLSEKMNFTAYDRMIPAQDRHLKKGFGNLIALPLKYQNVQNGALLF
ncbi:hypothetical protein SAMN02745116_00909 [Pilibacter termitis]|uniref:TOTE conflict system primase domain-containing protein n=1 Tax=Pilibacter termitis TaxID=263852 RepID=A0A1T4M3Q0_9ENTE|nr:hypothetical protein [Pilibacter termitis]SJZ61496.1 hypothetical protein SAMN02745116_00909 [Pilibacter termitis]